MIRVVHLFDVKKGVAEKPFVEWLDAKLSTAARQFGCVDRKTWAVLDGFAGSYAHPKPLRDRPRYVNEAYWEDKEGPTNFRKWLTETPEGKEVHERWFNSVENHTVIRYVQGWEKNEMEG